MLLMGDEYGHTKGGNNNTWALDNEKNYFLKSQLEKNRDLFLFVSELIKFRKEHLLEIDQKIEKLSSVFEEKDNALAFVLGKNILVLFNGSDRQVSYFFDKPIKILFNTAKEPFKNNRLSPYQAIVALID